MRDLLADYRRLSATSQVGRAVVTQVWGSSPRPEGATMLATADGRMAGSVTGGCVETAVVAEILEAIGSGKAKSLQYDVSHDRAWEFGLACGGAISLLVEPRVRPEILAAARRAEGSVVATVIGGTLPVGATMVYREDESVESTELAPHWRDPVRARAKEALASLLTTSATIEVGGERAELLFEVFPRRPTLLVFGAVHIAAALVTLAKPLGFRTIVADAREAFLTRERFPDADELVFGWPDEVFARVGIDRATCVCVLTHDPKFDEPALDSALRSPACYVGAIGSRKTQAMRRDRLAKAGYGQEEIARLHGPIGLDLGGRHPAEVALSILAEITAVRYGGKEARGRRQGG